MGQLYLNHTGGYGGKNLVNHVKKSRLLITGSEGMIGRIITNYLKDRRYNFITELDKKNPRSHVDILYDDIVPYFREIDSVIHLAANANPFIEKEEADKNVEMVRRVIGTCRNSNVKRIINASSINVYPYKELDKITRETKLEPNRSFNREGHYGRAKIECEGLFEEYCLRNNVSLINLRFGWVTKNDKYPVHKDEKCDTRDFDIELKQDDLIKIIEKSLEYEGIGSYVCVSKRGGLVDDSVRFPIN